MKLRLPVRLCSALLACCALGTTFSHAESISIKFGDDGYNSDGTLIFGEGGSSEVFFGNTEIGMESVAGVNWLMCAGASGSMTVADNLQITWRSDNTWTQNPACDLLDKYLDDNGGLTTSVSNIPYLSYDVFAIYACPNTGTTWNALNINGTYYTYNADGEVVVGTNAWGNNGDQSVISAGANVMVVTGVLGDLSLNSGGNNGSVRGSLAAIQIVNTYEGVYQYRTLSAGSAAWEDSVWSSVSGEPGTDTWEGAGHAAVINASAEGSTLTLGDDIAMDGMILRSGNLVLSGGSINLGAPGIISIFGDTTLTLGDVEFAGNASVSVSGTLVIGEEAVLPSEFSVMGTGVISYESESPVITSGISLNLNGVTLSNDSIEIESGSTLSVSNMTFDYTKPTGAGTLNLAGGVTLSALDASVEDAVYHIAVDRVEITGGETTINPGNSLPATTYQLGNEFHIYSGGSLHVSQTNYQTNQFATPVFLHDGGTFRIGESNGNATRLQFQEGIDVDAIQEKASFLLPSWGYMSNVTQLTGEGTFEIYRQFGVYEGDTSRNGFIIDGVAEDPDNWFTGTISLAGEQGYKHFALVLNHQNAATNAIIEFNTSAAIGRPPRTWRCRSNSIRIGDGER